MKTYTKEQIILSDGEVSIGNVTDWCTIDDYHIKTDKGFFVVEASTEKIEGLPHLDRGRFVRGVDVRALSKERYPYSKEGLTEVDADTMKMFARIWEAGYNTNTAVLTLDQARTIWAAGVEASGTFEDALKIVQPLSIPESITVDENFNVIDVKWE